MENGIRHVHSARIMLVDIAKDKIKYARVYYRRHFELSVVYQYGYVVFYTCTMYATRSENMHCSVACHQVGRVWRISRAFRICWIFNAADTDKTKIIARGLYAEDNWLHVIIISYLSTASRNTMSLHFFFSWILMINCIRYIASYQPWT